MKSPTGRRWSGAIGQQWVVTRYTAHGTHIHRLWQAGRVAGWQGGSKAVARLAGTFQELFFKYFFNVVFLQEPTIDSLMLASLFTNIN